MALLLYEIIYLVITFYPLYVIRTQKSIEGILEQSCCSITEA